MADLTGIDSLPGNITAAIRSTATIDRFDVTKNTSFDENILRARLIVFHPASDLKIGKADDPFVALVADRVFFQDGNQECQIFVPAALPASGASGANGHSGHPGGNGVHGGDGEDGADLPPFVFLVGEIGFEAVPYDPTRILLVTADGVSGGDGGNGGDGGDGAHGANGRDGSMECEHRDRFGRLLAKI